MIVLTKLYRPEFIFATLGVAFFGSYACICLVEQYRLYTKEKRHMLLGPITLLSLMSVCLGGVAIWSMHFIGMSSMTLLHPVTRESIHIDYQLDFTLLSLFAVTVLSYAGLYVASNTKRFTQSSVDVVRDYVDEVANMSIAEIRQMRSRQSVLKESLFQNLTPIVLGGVITAGGVCIMHYLGMQAIVFQGRIQWNYGIIVASIVIAIVAATAAFWILFRLLALYPKNEHFPWLSASVASIAVNGMHYTGMAAGEFVFDADRSVNIADLNLFEEKASLFGCAIVSTITVLIVFILVIADLRRWSNESRAFLKTLNERAQEYDITLCAHDRFLKDFFNIRSKYKEKVYLTESIGSGTNKRTIYVPNQHESSLVV